MTSPVIKLKSQLYRTVKFFINIYPLEVKEVYVTTKIYIISEQLLTVFVKFSHAKKFFVLFNTNIT